MDHISRLTFVPSGVEPDAMRLLVLLGADVTARNADRKDALALIRGRDDFPGKAEMMEWLDKGDGLFPDDDSRLPPEITGWLAEEFFEEVGPILSCLEVHFVQDLLDVKIEDVMEGGLTEEEATTYHRVQTEMLVKRGFVA